ncbi:MAG: dihydrolipoyl dehydrogenase [Nanoarchaeota archaeon]
MAIKNTIKADVAVIGAGPGGYVAAIRLAQLGKKVALIDKDNLGGICLNCGCIPSKALIYASELFGKIKEAEAMGIKADSVSMDFARMQEWKNGIISNLANGISFLCKQNNIEVVKGLAVFESSNKLKIDGNEEVFYVEFEKAIIAVGSKPTELPNFKFDGKQIISSTEALSLEKIPENLVVVGGGYIGLELGTVYAKLGTKVFVVEMADQLLPGFDKSIVMVLERNLNDMGVEIYLNAKAEKFDNGKVIVDSKEKGKVSLDADNVLVAVGRAPIAKELKLENTKVKLDEKGFVKVDKSLMTTDKNIYAIGDVSEGPMLAHKASAQGKFVAELIAGEKVHYDRMIVPSVIFTDPEIAAVGLSEKEADEEGIKVKTGKYPFSASGRAMTKNKTEGFVKVIANSKDDKIIGVEIVGSDASDLISEAALAIRLGATLEDVALTIHPHPTLSEGLMEAAEAAMGKAIHIFNVKKE